MKITRLKLENVTVFDMIEFYFDEGKITFDKLAGKEISMNQWNKITKEIRSNL